MYRRIVSKTRLSWNCWNQVQATAAIICCKKRLSAESESVEWHPVHGVLVNKKDALTRLYLWLGGTLNAVNFVNLVQAFSYWFFVLLNNNKTSIPVLHRLESFVFSRSRNYLLAQPWGHVGSSHHRTRHCKPPKGVFNQTLLATFTFMNCRGRTKKWHSVSKQNKKQNAHNFFTINYNEEPFIKLVKVSFLLNWTQCFHCAN